MRVHFDHIKINLFSKYRFYFFFRSFLLSFLLSSQDRDLFEHVGGTFQKFARREDGGGGGGTEDRYIAELLEESVLHLFVGHLSINTCCFVWDQCLMVKKIFLVAYFARLCIVSF